MTYVDRGAPGAGDGFEDADYRRVGIGDDDAGGWRRWAIEPIDAIRWIQADVHDPVEATQWSAAAVSPGAVARLREAGLSSSRAAQWHEFGADTKTALAEHAAGRGPADYRKPQSRGAAAAFAQVLAKGRGLRAVAAAQAAQTQSDDDANLHDFGSVRPSYVQLTWTDDSAKAWAAVEIDAFDAQDWLLLGLTPVEAAALEREGHSATATALAWWRAGIPSEEVADWIGAGFSPEEALAQRAKGVTGEQAAVLRSLRQAERD